MSNPSQELLTFLCSQKEGEYGSQKSYHKNLEDLRDSGDKTFLFLRTLVELTSYHYSIAPINSQQNELLFHSILGFRHVVLYRWNQFHPDFRSTFRDFILCLGLGHESIVNPLPKSVANACLSCSAAFWKRCWRNDHISNDAQLSAEENHLLQLLVSHPISLKLIPNNDTMALFGHIESIIVQSLSSSSVANTSISALLHRATMSTSFLSCLIGEFSGGNTAAAYNCSLEFHRLSHVAFEEKGLQMCLKISIFGLSSIISQLSSVGGMNGNLLHLAVGTVNLTIDVLSWEFGSIGGKWGRTGGSGLVRPPETWREWIVRPDFLGAIFELYKSLRGDRSKAIMESLALENLKHLLRQLLILLSSITGTIFADRNEKIAYSGFMIDGCLSVLSLALPELVDGSKKSINHSEQLESEVVDMCSMIARLVSNFRVELLSQLPTFENMLSAINTVGDTLLKISLDELKKVQGDSELVEGGYWRNEALGYLLESVVSLTDDNWLFGIRPGNAQDIALSTMSKSLASMYHSYVRCRIDMAKMEEYFITMNATELDEVREEIVSMTMEEEMSSACSLGRVNLESSISCLCSLFQTCFPRLKQLFETEGNLSPNGAATLEETRLLLMCTCHLLTDDALGESPRIPEAVLNACSKPTSSAGDFKRGNVNYVRITSDMVAMVNNLISLAEFQVSKIAINPNNHHLSPLIAKTLLWFLKRWGPAYILSLANDSGSSSSESNSGEITDVWNTKESGGEAVSFCVSLCLRYQCFWPQEAQVQEACCQLLLALAKRGRGLRLLLMNSKSMEHLIVLHSITAARIHASQRIDQPHAGLTPAIINGYKRIPYKFRGQLLTAILIASSEVGDFTSESSFKACLDAVQNAFGELLVALETKRVKIDCVITKDMICLCVELFDGIARSSEMSHPERVPIFLSPILPRLSQLMSFYASDIIICELLLKFFCSYAEHFITMLDREQSLSLFRSSAELLKAYSTNHCNSRSVRVASKKSTETDLEEEQSYSDILCAIQLLNHLGAKDFVDSFSSERIGSDGVDTHEVTEVIFFGLQQILPLMTKGLMSFPTLCNQYFSLVGFTMETYAERVGALPYELFKGLLDSMLFGMSHANSYISKCSLEGISALAQEQIERKSISSHLAQDENIFDDCSFRLLQEVIFQSIIWDRLEPSALALLGLASVDMNRFVNVVHKISSSMDIENQHRLQNAFQRLMQPDVISKVANGNFGGRLNKMRFRKDFEDFVKDIHSAVLIF